MSKSTSKRPTIGIFLNAKFVKIKIVNGNKNKITMLEVRLFPKSQIRLYNNALINLNPHQQIPNPLNQRVQVFLHLNQSYNFLMQL